MPSLVQNAVQQAPHKNHKILNFVELNFPFKDYIFFHVKLLFILFGLVMRKLWKILFLGPSNYLLEKNTYRIHFLIQFLQFFKTIVR